MPDGFAGRYEVLEDRGAGRRTWPTDMKLRIVGESHAPGVMVSKVARRHRLMPSQVTTWRRLYREGKLGSAPTSPMFVPLMLEDPEPPQPVSASTAGPEPSAPERIEIEIEAGGVVIRLGPSRPAMRIAEIAAALREGRP